MCGGWPSVPPAGPSADHPPPRPSLPLRVEGASGVQQQEELPLGLGAVPREEIMLQGHGAGGSAHHVDLAALQSTEREGNRSGVGSAHIPTHLRLLASPVFPGSRTGRLSSSSYLPTFKWVWAMFPAPLRPAPPPPRSGHSLLWPSSPPTPTNGGPSTRDTHLTQSSQQIQGRWGQWRSEG